MAMKRCPVCGEKYSDTYRTCPFCEEEEALRSERPVRRRGGKRSAAREDPGILTPMLVIVIVILAMTLAWLFFGDQIKGSLFPGGTPAQSAQSSQTGDTGTAPSGGEVKLNREDFTLSVGESFQLKSTGVTTTPTWSSSNPGVATVNGSGVVTGVSAGMTTVTMSYDGSTLTCIVRVK